MFRQLFGYMGVSPLLPLPCFTMNYLKMYRLLCIQHQGIKFSLILDVIHSPTLTVASWQITCPRHSQLQILVVLLFKMAPKCSAKVLPSAPKCEKAVICLPEKIGA